MSNTTTKTAAETYASRRRDIARLIDVLQMELDAHVQRAALNDRHWGYPGDLEEVRSQLIALVERMSGQSEEAIERFLDEAAD